MRTKEIRSEALESFIKCFNLCYPNWEVEGDASTELTADHVEYSYRTACLASCGPRDQGHVYFAINKSWYGDATPAERLGLLIHELGHVKYYSGHPPEFWEQVIENYRSLAGHSETVEEVMFGNLSWPDVREFIVNDPYTDQVDNRQEIAYERRRKLADALDYPLHRIEPFKKMTIKYQTPRSKNTKTVPLWRLNYEVKFIDEVIAYFHTRPREYLSKWKSQHIIQPLPVRKVGNTYDVIDGHEMVNLAELVEFRRLSVQIMDEKTPQESTSQEGYSD